MKKCLDIVWSEPDEHQSLLVNIDSVSAASCDEILLHDTLDYIPNRIEGLQKVVSKLKYGGTLTIEGNDLIDWARNIFITHKNLDEANRELYDGKQSIDDINNVCYNLEQFGLEITYKRLMATRYSIKAKRPDARN